jgi:hypothetical protein
MEMVPKLIQHRLQLPLRIASGLADKMCRLAQCARRTSGRLQSVQINSYKLDQVTWNVTDDLTAVWRSKSQLVSRFAAVLLLVHRTLFCKRWQVVLSQAQAGEARAVGK